ncbi:hypothetical protein GPECTOR_84g329 [Gonium pectorale]|uniref:Uncharacterized protein n=1 Tax=Gonium pectorale TaxID=33097 RepID=A0A150G1A8_GONPE|nr:hypothetical protein GPECTOR_84g329 [Gonium pectorale]|eukprot:KXZ43653.1 hypothetical protein GPECTOR_84g329 [Gonium pectorale]
MHGRYRTNLTVSVEHAEEYYIRDPHDGSEESLAATSPLSAKGVFLQLTPAYSAAYEVSAAAGGGGTDGSTADGGAATGGGNGELLLRYRLHVTIRGCQAFHGKVTPAFPSACTEQAGCHMDSHHQQQGGRRSCLWDALESVQAVFMVGADTGVYHPESLCLGMRVRGQGGGAPSCCLGTAGCAAESAVLQGQLEACNAAEEASGSKQPGQGRPGPGASSGPSSSSSGKRNGTTLLDQVVNVFSLLARQTHIRRSNVSEELPVDGTVYKEGPAAAAAAATDARPPRRHRQRRREGEVVGEPAPYMLNSQTDVHDQHDGSGGGGGSHTYTVQRSFLVPTDMAHEAMEESGTADIAAGEFLTVL